MEFLPTAVLRPYVKNYTVINVDQGFEDQVFYPSGYVDFAVNISNGTAITIINGRPIYMPKVEILGQLTVPTRLTVSKGMSVLIARIYPFANSLFFPNPISQFTNDSIDLQGVLSLEVNELYDQVVHTNTMEQKIKVLDLFFIKQMKKNEHQLKKTNFIAQLCQDISAENYFDIRRLSANYGLSERYIQKLFENVVGLAPRAFFNTQRFNRSLELIRSSDLHLTSIAYDCGYYDQAHFIKEFRKFTGITPSEARPLLLGIQ
ncbi:MAG TPA: helix-turn-helix transcriptional regulator [Cyclobacteriaceae bacterium]|nr:helix-turn-helix transcriptional regulator [Cyclobacteriaceae bacterium]